MVGMGSERRMVTTADGRTLEVLVAGNPGGYPWLWVPGTPSAAVDYPRLDDMATRLDLRLVSWSRPGYGDSSARPLPPDGPRIVDDVPDIEAIVDALGPRPGRRRRSGLDGGDGSRERRGLHRRASGTRGIRRVPGEVLSAHDVGQRGRRRGGVAPATDADRRGDLNGRPGSMAGRDDAPGWCAGCDRRARRRVGARGAMGVRRAQHPGADGHLGRWAGRDRALRTRPVAGGTRAGSRRPPR